MRYAFALAGAAIAILCIGIVGIWLFAGIWTRVGFGAACVVVFGGILLIAWRKDRQDKAARAGLENV